MTRRVRAAVLTGPQNPAITLKVPKKKPPVTGRGKLEISCQKPVDGREGATFFFELRQGKFWIRQTMSASDTLRLATSLVEMVRLHGKV